MNDIDDVKVIRADALREANAKRRAQVAAGEAPQPRPPANAVEQAKRDPKSKTKALRAYCWDMEKVIENQGTPEAMTQRRVAESNYRGLRKRSREIGLPALIKAICWDCVYGDVDPGGGDRIVNCTAASCPLHPVRPKKARLAPQHPISQF